MWPFSGHQALKGYKYWHFEDSEWVSWGESDTQQPVFTMSAFFYNALLHQILYPKTLIVNFYMLSSNNVTTTLIEESYFLLVSGGSWWNFNVHSMEDCVTSLNDLYKVSTKRLVEQIFINKVRNRSLRNPHVIWRNSFQNMFTSRCNCYVTVIVANNTFSNNFKYLYCRKSQTSFEHKREHKFLWKWCFL